MAYRFSRQADQDVIEIYLESAERFGRAHADRYIADLYDTLAFLADNPKAARERTELRRPVRVHPYQTYVIVYRIDGPHILILRLRHGREDWQSSPDEY